VGPAPGGEGVPTVGKGPKVAPGGVPPPPPGKAAITATFR